MYRCVMFTYIVPEHIQESDRVHLETVIGTGQTTEAAVWDAISRYNHQEWVRDRVEIEVDSGTVRICGQACGTVSSVDEKWEDVSTPLDADIRAAHPLRTGNHERYGRACEMVRHRYSKINLISLVNYLLSRIEDR